MARRLGIGVGVGLGLGLGNINFFIDGPQADCSQTLAHPRNLILHLFLALALALALTLALALALALTLTLALAPTRALTRCTLAQAKARALELPGCAGFTFKSTNLTPALPSGSADIDTASYTPDRYRVYFKSRRNGKTDGLWQTYLLADWTGADPAQTPWP